MDKSMSPEDVVRFKEKLIKFSHDVNELIRDASLSEKKEFLKRVAGDVNDLYQSAGKVQAIKEEEIEEIGNIVKNIFVQPIRTQEKEITILKAAEIYQQQEKEHSDLSFILHQYIIHEEATKSFLRELEILTQEVDFYLENIA